MAAGIHSKDAVFLLNNVALTGVKEVGSVGIGESPTVDTTSMGDSVASIVKGVPSGGSISISGLAAAGTTDLSSLGSQAATPMAYSWEWRPQGTGTGKGKISGTGYVTNYTQSGSFSDVVQWSATVAVTGSVTFGVQ